MFRTRALSLLRYTVLTVSMVCLLGLISSAQTAYEPTDTYQVNYYSNALTDSLPDATVHIVNPGTAVTKLDADGRPLNGDLCAFIYVLNNDEQEVECCGCRLTPDSERTLSVDSNLLGNPFNPATVTHDGVIKVVSAPYPANHRCRPDNEGVTPEAGLRAWATHIQATAETEEEFAAAPLSDNELFFLQNQCSAIYTSGSGAGICSCGYGD